MAATERPDIEPLRSLIAGRFPITADTDVALRVAAMLLKDSNARGEGLRASLRLQCRLMVGAGASDDQLDEVCEHMAHRFGATDRWNDRSDETTGVDLSPGATGAAERLAALRRLQRWPEVPPDELAKQEELHFFTPASREALLLAIGEMQPPLIVEVGAWVGTSTRFLMEHSAAHVVTIDTWLGSEEHQPGRAWYERDDAHGALLDVLHRTFLANCWPHRERLTPLRTASLNGFHWVRRYGLEPDLIFLDGAHDGFSVAAELEMASRFFPQARIVVDDFNRDETWLAGLVDAVERFVSRRGRVMLEHGGNACTILPEGQGVDLPVG